MCICVCEIVVHMYVSARGVCVCMYASIYIVKQITLLQFFYQFCVSACTDKYTFYADSK